MTRHSVLCAFTVAAIAATSAGMASQAGGTIKGTVTTGLASNADVVVFVQQAPGTFLPGKPLVMDQKQMQFLPHVLPVVAGTSVKFLNSDPTPHNVFSPDYEKYNLGTWPQGNSKDYTFSKCAKLPCVYTQLCRVHPEMEGFVVVLQNPYFAVTDKQGRYEIANVPPGDHTVAVWHVRRKAEPKPATVDTSTPATVDFALGR